MRDLAFKDQPRPARTARPERRNPEPGQGDATQAARRRQCRHHAVPSIIAFAHAPTHLRHLRHLR